MVQQAVDIFNAHDDFILALAPEGTRKKVEKLRTGFYFIAKGANVPIVPVGFDFATRSIVVGNPMMPTDNFDQDMDYLLTFYRKMKGKNPAVGSKEKLVVLPSVDADPPPDLLFSVSNPKFRLVLPPNRIFPLFENCP